MSLRDTFFKIPSNSSSASASDKLFRIKSTVDHAFKRILRAIQASRSAPSSVRSLTLFRQPALTAHCTGEVSSPGHHHLPDGSRRAGASCHRQGNRGQGDLFNSTQWRSSHGSIICSLTRVGNTDPPEIPLGGFLYNLNTQLGP